MSSCVGDTYRGPSLLWEIQRELVIERGDWGKACKGVGLRMGGGVAHQSV